MIPWKRKWQFTPILLPGEAHGQRSLVGYRPWGCKELDTTEQLVGLLELKIYLQASAIELLLKCKKKRNDYYSDSCVLCWLCSLFGHIYMTMCRIITILETVLKGNFALSKGFYFCFCPLSLLAN